MWNNLRARHYSVLILLAIVALETSAIAIDKFINQESETAFTIESPFQNNAFIQSFKTAETSNAAVPVVISSARRSTPAVAVTTRTSTPAQVVPEVKIRSVSAEFVAAANEKDRLKKYIEYSVQPGDSLSNIAVQFGSEADLITKANSLEDKHNIKAGQTLKVPLPSSEMVYTVRRGDSLSKIASRFRVPLKTLIDENNLKSHKLMADQRIKIPVTGNNSEIKIADENGQISEPAKKLELVKANSTIIVPTQKLEMIKVENLQMAQAPASKPKIEFIEKELLKTPPTLNKAVVSAAKPELQAPAAKATVVAVETATPVATKVAASENVAADEKEVSYTVAKGDNLLKIAHRFNTTVAQIQQDNSLDGTMLKIGQQLQVNPNKKLYRVVKTERTRPENATKVVTHKVASGESLSLIARKYQTTISAIVSENNMTNTVVMAGQDLKVPTQASYKIIQKISKAARATWKMPVRGRLSDKYGWRKHPVYRKRLFHAGIDVAAPKGAPIAAAQNGKVIYAGRRAGYGNLVIISHANGFSTRYAHCSSILVKKGQNVKAGQLVAKVGATGVATGNHLHFEIRKNGKTQNPLTYLN